MQAFGERERKMKGEAGRRDVAAVQLTGEGHPGPNALFATQQKPRNLLNLYMYLYMDLYMYIGTHRRERSRSAARAARGPGKQTR